MTRKCFFSFHFKRDNWRVATIRNIGSIEGNKPASDNDWESITSGSDKEQKIKNWIADQMKGKSCSIVLVGNETANRKWIKYEIIESWNKRMGVVGIYIHGFKNSDGYISNKGKNPFSFIGYGNTGKKLSSIVNCYDPSGSNSKERYEWVTEHLANAVAEAIRIRNEN